MGDFLWPWVITRIPESSRQNEKSTSLYLSPTTTVNAWNVSYFVKTYIGKYRGRLTPTEAQTSTLMNDNAIVNDHKATSLNSKEKLSLREKKYLVRSNFRRLLMLVTVNTQLYHLLALNENPPVLVRKNFWRVIRKQIHVTISVENIVYFLTLLNKETEDYTLVYLVIIAFKST